MCDKNHFFTAIPWTCLFTCKNCKLQTNVISKVRFSGGSILTYLDKVHDLNDAEKTILDNKEHFGPNLHYGFQCQDCGAIKTTKSHKNLYYTVETEVQCNCGGHLSRHYPIFCPHCRYNKVENWDAEAYKTQLKEQYDLAQKELESKIQRKHGEDGWVEFDGEWFQF